MQSLSIIQPYAELIASGVKRVENRTWSTSYRGPLAIHAGKADAYLGQPVADLARHYGIDPDKLVFGAVIAVAELVGCVQSDRIPERNSKVTHLGFHASDKVMYPWLADHEHTEGPVCFILEEVRRLPTPLLCRGQQKLFDVDDKLIELGLAGKAPGLEGQRVARTLAGRGR